MFMLHDFNALPGLRESHTGGWVIAGAALGMRQLTWVIFIIVDSKAGSKVKQKPVDGWWVDEGWSLGDHHTLRRAWAGRGSAFWEWAPTVTVRAPLKGLALGRFVPAFAPRVHYGPRGSLIPTSLLNKPRP